MQPVINKQLKLWKELQEKKFRKSHGLFIVEGIKQVRELIESKHLLIKELLISEECPNLAEFKYQGISTFLLSESQFRSISNLQNPQGVALVMEMNLLKEFDFEASEWILAIDGVQDPGNMGTILRLADWFGFRKVIVSDNSVEITNPKVIQASMGAAFHLQIMEKHLPEYFENRKNLQLYGFFLNGDNIYNQTLDKGGVLVLGNEGNGISSDLEQLIQNRSYIPSFADVKGGESPESLNVAMASSIGMSIIRQGLLKGWKN